MTRETPIPVTVGAAFETDRYFVMTPGFRGGGRVPGLRIVNEDALILPGSFVIEPPNGDPHQYSERPHLRHDPAKGGPPRDIEEMESIWIVSDALRRVFEAVDPEAFAFATCDYTPADGAPADGTRSDGTAGPQYHFCDVRRRLDALDEAASRLKIKVGDYVNGKYYSLVGGASLVFRPDAVGTAHVFRTPYADTVFCDRVMRDAILAANIDGMTFTDVADC